MWFNADQWDLGAFCSTFVLYQISGLNIFFLKKKKNFFLNTCQYMLDSGELLRGWIYKRIYTFLFTCRCQQRPSSSSPWTSSLSLCHQRCRQPWQLESCTPRGVWNNLAFSASARRGSISVGKSICSVLIKWVFHVCISHIFTWTGIGSKHFDWLKNLTYCLCLFL